LETMLRLGTGEAIYRYSRRAANVSTGQSGDFRRQRDANAGWNAMPMTNTPPAPDALYDDLDIDSGVSSVPRPQGGAGYGVQARLLDLAEDGKNELAKSFDGLVNVANELAARVESTGIGALSGIAWQAAGTRRPASARLPASFSGTSVRPCRRLAMLQSVSACRSSARKVMLRLCKDPRARTIAAKSQAPPATGAPPAPCCAHPRRNARPHGPSVRAAARPATACGHRQPAR
jgi:hypothetical protein